MEIHPSWDCSGKIPHSVSPFPPHPFLSSVSDGRRAEPSSWSGRKSGGRLNVALMICSSSTARISYMNCVSPQSPKCILERLWAQMPEKTFIYFSFFSLFFFQGDSTSSTQESIPHHLLVFYHQEYMKQACIQLYPMLFLTENFLVLIKMLFTLFNGEREKIKEERETDQSQPNLCGTSFE